MLQANADPIVDVRTSVRVTCADFCEERKGLGILCPLTHALSIGMTKAWVSRPGHLENTLDTRLCGSTVCGSTLVGYCRKT